TDLLHFIVGGMDLLTEVENEDGITTIHSPAKVELNLRRPDILDIELSCKNTNTPVPYIDLVNEVLENAIAPNTGTGDDRWGQTDGTSEEISVNPEHINNEAYRKLANEAFYPWNLPWNLPVEEVRLWLRHLGVERVELMRAFQRIAADGEEAYPTYFDIAAEQMGLTKAERDILTGEFRKGDNDEPHIWEYWGLQEADNPVPDPDDLNNTQFVGWFEALSCVGVFMQRSGLSFEQTEELFDLRFIDPNSRIDVTHPSSCNHFEARIEPLRRVYLEKAHRFLRLWHKLGWTMRELDEAIYVLSGEKDVDFELNNQTLLDLSNIQYLLKELNLPLETLLTWWGDINSHRYTAFTETGRPEVKSLYDRLFRNKTVLDPPDEAFTEDPGDLNGSLSGHVIAISAAFGISAVEYDMLIGSQIVLPGNQNDPVLNLENLSALYRHITLAKTLRLSFGEYIVLRKLITTDPFINPESAVAFIDQVGKLRSGLLNITELNYLLRHEFSPTFPGALDEGSMLNTLNEIRTGLRKIQTDNLSGQDSDPATIIARQSSLIIERLAAALNLKNDIADILLGQVLTPRGNASTALENFRYFTGLSAVYYNTINLAGAEIRRIDTQINFNWGTATLPEGIDFTGFSARWVGKILSPGSGEYTFHIRANSGCRLWIDNQPLVDQWQNQEITEHSSQITLTKGRFYGITLEYFNENETGILELSWTRPSLMRETLPEQYLYPQDWDDALALYQLMYKIALIINRFKISDWELRYIAHHGEWFNGFRFNDFPLTPQSAPSPSYQSWESMCDFLGIRKLFPLGAEALRAVLDAAEVEPALDAFSEHMEWDREMVGILAGPEGINLHFPQDFRNGKAFPRLFTCLRLIKRLGVSVEQCRILAEFTWQNEKDVKSARTTAKNAVKSKYVKEQWLSIAKPIQNTLREQRRTALVSYLVNHPDDNRPTFKDANELFNYYLIDPEMSACMMTSRIKQAISSVQFFIQRCMMNLELAGYPDPEDDWTTYWPWMKNYRVWEANRKVFLYPENWIEPELRDD
ncbi:MAG TPA: PA14 domain-containing protein, partial [Cyclobacteriaceae bacterium]|nr:PA14 domain-containing protein [Cyclobacteriaceae bacterium]